MAWGAAGNRALGTTQPRRLRAAWFHRACWRAARVLIGRPRRGRRAIGTVASREPTPVELL
eukprot:11402483-Alexandrium_andersonii.AAC.1